MFFAYLRSRAPDAINGVAGISNLPRALQTLVAQTEYPPLTPELMQNATSKVVMIVDAVSPTPFALLKRATQFDYRSEDRELRMLAECTNPEDALTDECRRVLDEISSTNHSHSSRAKRSNLADARSPSGLPTFSTGDDSWTRFRDEGFQSVAVNSSPQISRADSPMLSRRDTPPQSGLQTRAQSRLALGSRPTTPSWADYLSTAFNEDGRNQSSPALLLSPDKRLPPINRDSKFADSFDDDDDSNVDPGELASITKYDIDDSFWWVWITSLAGEETATRKSAFGRCALIETKIGGGRWMLLEEQVKGAAPSPEMGAYIAEKKSRFGFGRKNKTVRASVPEPVAKTPLSRDGEPLRTPAAIAKENMSDVQRAKMSAAAAALVRSNSNTSASTQRRGRLDDNASTKTNSVMTLGLTKEANSAMQWANAYDKDAIRKQYLGDNFAGIGIPRGSASFVPASNINRASSVYDDPKDIEPMPYRPSPLADITSIPEDSHIRNKPLPQSKTLPSINPYHLPPMMEEQPQKVASSAPTTPEKVKVNKALPNPSMTNDRTLTKTPSPPMQKAVPITPSPPTVKVSPSASERMRSAQRTDSVLPVTPPRINLPDQQEVDESEQHIHPAYRSPSVRSTRSAVVPKQETTVSSMEPTAPVFKPSSVISDPQAEREIETPQPAEKEMKPDSKESKKLTRSPSESGGLKRMFSRRKDDANKRLSTNMTSRPDFEVQDTTVVIPSQAMLRKIPKREQQQEQQPRQVAPTLTRPDQRPMASVRPINQSQAPKSFSPPAQMQSAEVVQPVIRPVVQPSIQPVIQSAFQPVAQSVIQSRLTENPAIVTPKHDVPAQSQVEQRQVEQRQVEQRQVEQVSTTNIHEEPVASPTKVPIQSQSSLPIQDEQPSKANIASQEVSSSRKASLKQDVSPIDVNPHDDDAEKPRTWVNYAIAQPLLSPIETAIDEAKPVRPIVNDATSPSKYVQEQVSPIAENDQGSQSPIRSSSHQSPSQVSSQQFPSQTLSHQSPSQTQLHQSPTHSPSPTRSPSHQVPMSVPMPVPMPGMTSDADQEVQQAQASDRWAQIRKNAAERAARNVDVSSPKSVSAAREESRSLVTEKAPSTESSAPEESRSIVIDSFHIAY